MSRGRGGFVLLLGPVLVWAGFQLVYWIREKRHGTKPSLTRSSGRRRLPASRSSRSCSSSRLRCLAPAGVPGAEGRAGGRSRRREAGPRACAALPAAPLLRLGGATLSLGHPGRDRRRPGADVPEGGRRRQLLACRDAELIDENQDYLELEEAPGTPRGGNDTSAVYYHVTRGGDEGRVYVDYWWFYPRNPSPVADKVFCGPGLRTPPFTCQEHAGDWEGLTVVLLPCSDCQSVGEDSLAPVEIRYGHTSTSSRTTGTTCWSRSGARSAPRPRRRSVTRGATSSYLPSLARRTVRWPSSRGTATPRIRAPASAAASSRPGISPRRCTTAPSPGSTTRTARTA